MSDGEPRTLPKAEPALARAKSALGDAGLDDESLRPILAELAEAYERTVHSFMKTLRISDGYQLRLKELNEALDKATRTDYLTGLMNRRSFFELAKAELSRARRHGASFCVLMADIDDFKAVNDRLGHDAGDAVLVAAAQAIGGALREEDLKVRWGGEEFLALLPDTSLAGALAAAEKLRARVAAAAAAAASPVTISVGVAQDRGGSVDELIRDADLALLRAKAEGKDRVVAARA